jgi:hypothetical protein
MTEMSVSRIVQQLYALLNTVSATVDEQLQVAGAEAFNRFQKYVLPQHSVFLFIEFPSGGSIALTKRFITIWQQA